MKKHFRLLAVLSLVLWTALSFGQGTTTSGITGRILDDTGNPLTGATVVAVESATGTQFGTISDEKGYFRLPNMNPGGPYILTVTYVGFKEYKQENMFLSLGQTFRVDVKLSESVAQLKGVEVVAERDDVFDGNRSGPETVILDNTIQQIPTLNRSINDYVRLTPQMNVKEGGISMSGMNNRYNAISVDGAVNNDVFGLSPTGTNGGQTGGTPFSMDIIDQFQVPLAPYDVRQGGFAGASINAVTKRGKNYFEGTAYFFMQNENLAGKTPYALVENEADPDAARTKLSDFSDYVGGLSVGGPIIKDKLFFFFNGEIQRRTTPHPYLISDYSGDATSSDLDQLIANLNSFYGYDAGGYTGRNEELSSNKIFGRIDWNINKVHKLMFRYSYVTNNNIDPYNSNKQVLYFSNYGENFKSTTQSTALQLKSNWENYSNDLIIGYTAVRDNRDPLGANFPMVQINDGAGDIYFGSEPFSTANQLDQDILTLNDNFSIYKGAHTITVGANVEFNHTYNLFIRQNFGAYIYNSFADFMSNFSASPVHYYQYDRSYSLVDDKTGDGSAAAAKFNMMQAGIYAQDEWQVNNKFKLTFGLRLDMPIYLEQPLAATNFNDSVIPVIEAVYDPISGSNYSMHGAQSGKMPNPQLMINPRIGFNWDILGEEKIQLRGGVGIFTSRLPLVWPGGAYNNTGMTVGGVRYRPTESDPNTAPYVFNPNWETQPTYQDFYNTPVATPQGQLDLFSDNFKLPQVLRTNLAVDKKLPWGMVATAEFVYTKVLNNIIYYNMNVAAPTKKMTGGPDNRWLYGSGKIDNRFSYIMVGSNTNEGYSWDATLQLKKNFSNGLQASVAYTYGQAKSMNDGLSSQNSSQWRYVANVDGRNHIDLSWSAFDPGHRVMAFIGYKKEYAKHFATGLSIFYNGGSGNRYSFVYNNSRYINAETSDDYALIWIPKDMSEINLIDYTTSDGTVITAAQQWENLNSFIENDKYLSENRGDYAIRNGGRLPFQSYLDLRFLQDFYLNVGKSRHTLQVTLDVFNFLNLLNKKWGVSRYVNYSTYELINIEGMEEDGTTPKFTYKGGTDPDAVYNVADPASRWRMQIGIRYIFGKNNN